MKPWIGVDLDGTLAKVYWDDSVEYDPHRIGDPVPKMVVRVKEWLEQGITVKIVTARVDGGEVGRAMGVRLDWVVAHNDVDAIARTIQDWCELHVGARLEVTCRKDYGMIELWDDRCFRVQTNTGELCCDVSYRDAYR